MPIDINILARQLEPESTALILGAGASIPSGAPTGNELRDILGQEFLINNYESFPLSDLATIIEGKRDRYSLIKEIRRRISRLQPTGGLLAIPRYPWAAIFTTNYDDLVEKAFAKNEKALKVYSSNFDFQAHGITEDQSLYKFHGSIEKDVSDGHQSRIIITSQDYDDVTSYREALYSTLTTLMQTKSVLIIGHSLADPDLRSLINEAQRIKNTSGAPGRIYVFSYQRDENLAFVLEQRGLSVCFGGIDQLASALLIEAPTEQLVLSVDSDILSAAPVLQPATLSVATEIANQTGQLERMFNGRPASYADVARAWTFERDVADQLEAQHSDENGHSVSIVLGVAGVGKTTAARKALHRLCARNIDCWQHKSDFAFDADGWLRINEELGRRKKLGVLLIDDAHLFLRELNILVERLAAQDKWCLRLILTTSKPHWNPRLKSVEFFRKGIEHEMSRLSTTELTSLLDLLDANRDVRSLVEDTFLGFSRPQRMERLRERCNADMFVCLKNIFAFEAIDEILLKEFAGLNEDLQEIYKVVSGLQAIGVRVHRELIRRTTGLEAGNIPRFIEDMEGIIDEYTVSEKMGIYGWRVRHPLIAVVISHYKYSNQDDLYDLFDKVLKMINPAYSFEAQSINDMCDLETGITRIVDKNKQNVILRQMISITPRSPVPRHRLIHNLIQMDRFDIAESEIRIFERELRIDGPVHRYKIRVKLGRARRADNIQETDRATLAGEAVAMAQKCLERFPDDKGMYRIALEAGTDWYRYTNDIGAFEDAMQAAQTAQERLLDPELRTIIRNYTRRAEEMGLTLYK